MQLCPKITVWTGKCLILMNACCLDSFLRMPLSRLRHAHLGWVGLRRKRGGKGKERRMHNMRKEKSGKHKYLYWLYANRAVREALGPIFIHIAGRKYGGELQQGCKRNRVGTHRELLPSESLWWKCGRSHAQVEPLFNYNAAWLKGSRRNGKKKTSSGKSDITLFNLSTEHQKKSPKGRIWFHWLFDFNIKRRPDNFSISNNVSIMQNCRFYAV